MKHLIFFLICSSLPALQIMCVAQESGTLKITVNNVKSGEGTVHVALFNDEDSFLVDEKEWKTGSARPDGSDRVIIEITDLPPGRYGISVMHDLNDNGELDTNFVGIPKEPFGFGNDTMGAFGPPSFEKASVEIRAGEETVSSVKLKSF